MYTLEVVLKKDGEIINKESYNLLEPPSATEKDDQLMELKEKTLKKRERQAVSDILLQLGMDPSLRGFGYIVTSVEILLQNPEAIHSIMDTLYPDVAKKHNTTGSRVERSIRHALDQIWRIENSETFKILLNVDIEKQDKPLKNSRFLALMYMAMSSAYPSFTDK